MKPGSIVLVRFPFTSLETEKKRPALVLSFVQQTSKIQLVTFAMITSKLDGLKLDGDVPLKDWKTSKLLHPSLCRLSKLATIDTELIDREIGALSEADSDEIARVFKKLYRTWL